MEYNKFIDVKGYFASDLEYLSGATNKDREVAQLWMDYIHIESSDKGGLLGIATDGRNLHLIDPLPKSAIEWFELCPGYWEILRTYKKEERVWLARLDDRCTTNPVFNYPDWKRIIPTEEAAYKTKFEGYTFDGHNYNELVDLIRGFPEKTVISLHYLNSLGPYTVWDVEWYSQTKVVKFTSGPRMALIMPIQPF